MLIGPEKSVEDDQARMNRSTRGQWDWYASHRGQIERLIVPAAPGGRICVLGAGNCNDLDLAWLARAYAEVRLVDIDRPALERAAARQGVGGNPRVVLDAPVDLTGVADMTGGWHGRGVSEADVAAAAKAATEVDDRPIGCGNFDVVLSPCVLSQLMIGVRDRVGKDHAGWPALKAAVYARHVRTVLGLTRPGGRAVLIIDVTSTSAVPGLDRARPEEWANVMRASVRDGKCFRGLEPAAVEAAVRRQGVAGPVQFTPPWLWHLGWGKAFLCYGVVVAKPSAGAIG